LRIYKVGYKAQLCAPLYSAQCDFWKLGKDVSVCAHPLYVVEFVRRTKLSGILEVPLFRRYKVLRKILRPICVIDI